jgi:hypothetical protein
VGELLGFTRQELQFSGFIERIWGRPGNPQLDGAAHSLVGATTAEMPIKSLIDLGLSWVPVSIQQTLGANDHPWRTVSTLGGLLLNKRLLQRVKILRGSQSFNSDNFRPLNRGCRHMARRNGYAINQHIAGSTLFLPTGVFDTLEVQVIPQNIEQGGIGFNAYSVDLSINL